MSRPCEKCKGSGVVTVAVTTKDTKPEDTVELKAVVCPLCRGTKVKSTITGK